MNKKILFSACLALVVQARAFCDEGADPKWLRWCSVSPDGKHIAFSYCGDIFTVPTTGGEARQLTTNTAYEYAPVWSPDSKHLAFASTREGSMDVFVTTIDGGAPKRVTTNSGSEIPVAFLDAQHLIYKASGMRSTDDLVFPSSTFPMLYQISIDGGRPEVYSEWPMDNPSIGNKGVLFEDIKGYEDYWRKHQKSSIARDIWLFDGDAYQKITDIFEQCSYDYDKNSETTKAFYAFVQNKLHFAITGKTAAELIYERADSEKPSMGLTTWKDAPDGKILKRDIGIAKNYLNEKELTRLNRLVTMFIDYAELMAEDGVLMSMQDWVDQTNQFLTNNRRKVLSGKGKISHEAALEKAEKEYEAFRIKQDQEYVSEFDREVEKYLKGE